MDPSFWHERWEAGRTGFHHDEPNPYLTAHLPALGLAPGARVLVPLCGKSVDLGWLSDRGLDPVGVELSPIAVEALFAERGVRADRVSHGDDLTWLHGGGIGVWCGDFFALDAGRAGRFDGLWDRAALIALPEDMRPDYVRRCAALMKPGARGLVVTLWYDPAEMDGPPFPVPPDEVETLYAPDFEVEAVAAPRVGAVPDHLRERGLTHLEEGAWRLARRA